ncbi:MAG: hypothetical protein M3320_09990, partial [Actinomycetota bacterium]|nr:hypothetical protein [Actinomycetota bacterium]
MPMDGDSIAVTRARPPLGLDLEAAFRVTPWVPEVGLLPVATPFLTAWPEPVLEGAEEVAASADVGARSWAFEWP